MTEATWQQAQSLLKYFEGLNSEQMSLILASGILQELREAIHNKTFGEKSMALIREALGQTPYRNKSRNKPKPLKFWKVLSPKVSPDIHNEVSAEAEFHLGKIEIPPAPPSIQLIKITPLDLGFTFAPKTRDLYDERLLRQWSAQRYKTHMVTLCQPYVGPLLRGQYREQPIGEQLHIVSTPLLDERREPVIFCVIRRNKLAYRLEVKNASPNTHWPVKTQLIYQVETIG